MASAGTESGPPLRQDRQSSEARVPPPTLTPESSTDSSELHLSTRGSVRRKLSKQKEAVDEPEAVTTTTTITSSSSTTMASTTTAGVVPVVRESPTAERTASEKEDSPSSMNPRSRQLVRGLALCGDDDTRLRPPPPALQRHPNSLSRDSSGTEYTDSSGVDLKAFVVATLHKNSRDRQMALWLEQQLTSFINDTRAQSFKFPQMSSYNRMLIHRVAALFGLDHNVDNSGKAVVVNKTDRSGRPDFDFSSLIQGTQFTDVNRRSYRSVQSFDEVRDPSLMGFGYGGGGGSVDNWWAMNRRTQSFEAASMAGHNGSPWSLRGNGAHSFETVPSQHFPDRSAMLRKAGSFGGVPAYYRSGSALEGSATDRPSNPHWRDYSPNGSVNSPVNVSEVAEGVAAMQVDTNHRSPASPQMVASNIHVATPPREYMYNYTYQPTAVYVPTPAMSPSAYGTPPYVVSTTVHQVAVAAHPNQLPYVSHPQAYMSPSYGYSDCGGGDYAMVQIPGPAPYPGHIQGSPVPPAYYSPHQAYYEIPYEAVAEVPVDVPATPSTSGVVPETTEVPVTSSVPSEIHRSLDGGYGSMTQQDSLREEPDCPADGDKN